MNPIGVAVRDEDISEGVHSDIVPILVEMLRQAGFDASICVVDWGGSSDYADILVEDIDDRWDREDCNSYRGKSNHEHKADRNSSSSTVTIEGAKSNDALASPVVADIEGDSIDERIYIGNLYGEMYRVDDIGKGEEPVVSTLFTFDNTTHDKNPIRAKADYAYAYELDHIWVYWGTGLYGS